MNFGYHPLPCTKENQNPQPTWMHPVQTPCWISEKGTQQSLVRKLELVFSSFKCFHSPRFRRTVFQSGKYAIFFVWSIKSSMIHLWENRKVNQRFRSSCIRIASQDRYSTGEDFSLHLSKILFARFPEKYNWDRCGSFDCTIWKARWVWVLA
jgi:hypothetical protein